MCDCVKQTIDLLKKTNPNAENIDFVNQDLISKRLFSTIELKRAGKKKPEKKLLMYKYCPMCGKPYEEGKN